jgi:hypothetical protein
VQQFVPPAPAPTPVQLVQVAHTQQPQNLVQSVAPELTLGHRQVQMVNGIEGDVDSTDLLPPRLNIYQRTSRFEGFTYGDIILGREHVLLNMENHRRGDHLEIIFVHVKKYYAENKPYGEQARFFRSKEEVFAAGLSIERSAKNGCVKMADLAILIRQPEHSPESQDKVFSVELPYGDDVAYFAATSWTVQSVAYSNIAAKIISAASSTCRDGFWKYSWRVNFRNEKFDKGDAMQPLMLLGNRLSEDAIVEVEKMREAFV